MFLISIWSWIVIYFFFHFTRFFSIPRRGKHFCFSITQFLFHNPAKRFFFFFFCVSNTFMRHTHTHNFSVSLGHEINFWNIFFIFSAGENKNKLKWKKFSNHLNYPYPTTKMKWKWTKREGKGQNNSTIFFNNQFCFFAGGGGGEHAYTHTRFFLMIALCFFNSIKNSEFSCPGDSSVVVFLYRGQLNNNNNTCEIKNWNLYLFQPSPLFNSSHVKDEKSKNKKLTSPTKKKGGGVSFPKISSKENNKTTTKQKKWLSNLFRFPAAILFLFFENKFQ